MTIHPPTTYALLIRESAQRYEEMCATLYTRSCALSELARAVDLARSSYECCHNHASKPTHRKQLQDWTHRASIITSGVMEVACQVHRQMLDALTKLDRHPLGPVAYQGLYDLGYDIEPIQSAAAALQTSANILRAYERQLGVCMTRFERDWLSVTASLNKSWSIFPSETISSGWWLSAPSFFQWQDLLSAPPFQLRGAPDLTDEQSLGAIYSEQKRELQTATATLLSEKPYPRKEASTLSNVSELSHTQGHALWRPTDPPREPIQEMELSALIVKTPIIALNGEYQTSLALHSDAQSICSQGESLTNTLSTTLETFQKKIAIRDYRRHLSGNADPIFFSEKEGQEALVALEAQLRNAHTVYQQFDAQIRNIQHGRQQLRLHYDPVRPTLLLKYHEETLEQFNIPMQALKQFRHLITLSDTLIQQLDSLHLSLIKTQTALTSILQRAAYAYQKAEGKTGWLDYVSWNYDYLSDVLNRPAQACSQHAQNQ